MVAEVFDEGGAGNAGSGGNGQGGGIYNGPASPLGTPTLSLERSIVALNRAEGGAGSDGTEGQGTGGGLYIGPGSTADAELTLIFANSASTSDDDVFGILV